MPPKKILSKKSKEERDEERASEMRLREQVMEKMRANTWLYDKGSPDYMNTKKKKDAISKLAAEVNISREKFEAVMKYLRDGYNKEKKTRSLEVHSGAAGPETAPTGKRVPFPFFQQMAFLEPHLRKKRSFNNLQPLENETDELQDNIENDAEAKSTDTGDVDISDELLNTTEEVATLLLDGIVDDTSGALTVELGNSPRTKTILEAIHNESVADATQKLFPQIPEEVEQDGENTAVEKRATPQISNSTAKKRKLEKGIEHPSTSLDNLPVLEEKQETIKERRTKVKREAEVFEKLSQVIEQADKALGTKEEVNEVALLCSRIEIVLAKIKNPRKKLQWRRKFESLIADVEDELLLLEDVDSQ